MDDGYLVKTRTGVWLIVARDAAAARARVEQHETVLDLRRLGDEKADDATDGAAGTGLAVGGCDERGGTGGGGGDAAE